MRQVFTSPRLENVEGIAKLLRDEGIDVRVTHGRSFKGGIRGDFSYREGMRTGPQPAVWVLKSEDQPRARELLRDAGLFETTRAPGESYLPPVFRDAELEKTATPQQRAFRIKMALLLAIAVALVLTLSRVF
jgi:hypothetical protein